MCKPKKTLVKLDATDCYGWQHLREAGRLLPSDKEGYVYVLEPSEYTDKRMVAQNLYSSEEEAEKADKEWRG